MSIAMNVPDQRAPLNVENGLDLLLVLLFAPGNSGREGEPIDGVTRLQKLVFLLNKEEGPGSIVSAAKTFCYQAYKMGPFSEELYNDISVLKSLGLLRTSNLEYIISDDADMRQPEFSDGEYSSKLVKSSRFELTDKGKKVASELFWGMSKKERGMLVEFKKFFNALPLRQLLIFVYNKYPEYTGRSEIRDQLDL